MAKIISIPKERYSGINEDAIIEFPSGLAVSDGAGGGGLFAELWSTYLVDNLPTEPILTYKDFDHWLSLIWEDFYNSCEEKAKALGGLALEKFYTEGAYATLAAIWISSQNSYCNWLTYGDSVVFHYRRKIDLLEYTVSSLESFNEQPYLVNCKDTPKEEGLRTGTFRIYSDSIVFVCSDALSHYILLMYMLEHKEQYAVILRNCINYHSKNATIVKTAMHIKCQKFQSILLKLISSSKNKANLRRHLDSLVRKGLLGLDDYSFGYIKI